jgi:hypothetical protein
MKVEIAPAKDPLVEQITGEHLTQILTAQLKKQDQLHERRMFRSRFVPIVSIVGVAVVLLILFAFCWLFLAWQKAEKIDLIVGIILGFAAGGFGGFGIGKMTERRKDE